MAKAVKSAAVIDLPDAHGAFVGNTLRPFTRDEFNKIKMILAGKKKRRSKLAITERDLRAFGLKHLIAESENGKPQK
jgi:hypothetical protein